MQAKKNEQNGMQNVYITVSNALDQSEKTRIEVARDVTIAQAIRENDLAPQGAFDIDFNVSYLPSPRPSKGSQREGLRFFLSRPLASVKCVPGRNQSLAVLLQTISARSSSGTSLSISSKTSRERGKVDSLCG